MAWDGGNNDKCYVGIINDKRYVDIKYSYEEWGRIVDLLDIAANELEKDGHSSLSKKIEIISIQISTSAGFNN